MAGFPTKNAVFFFELQTNVLEGRNLPYKMLSFVKKTKVLLSRI